MNTEFKVLIEAILDSKKIGKPDIDRIQRVLDKYHVNLLADIDKANLVSEIKKIVPQLEAELKKIAGIDIKVNDSDILKAIKCVEQENKEYTKLIDTMERVRTKSIEARKSEEARQNIAQNKAVNKSLEQEYTAREKIKNAITEQKYALEVLQAESQLKEYSTANPSSFNQAKNSVSDLNVAYNNMLKSSNNDLVASEEQYQKTLVLTHSLLGKLKLETKEVSLANKGLASEFKKTAEITKYQNYLTNNTRISKEMKNELHGFISTIQTSDNLTENDLKKMSSRFKELDSQMRRLDRLGLSWTDKFKKAWEKYGGWSFATGSFTAMFHQIKNGAQFISSLDSALTNINYTMDVSKKQLNNIGKASVDMAKELHTSTKNVLEAVTTYANANEKVESMLEKSKPTVMMSNVTGMNVSDTTDILQGTLEQFNLAEDKVLHVSDVIQKVSQNMNMDFAKGIKEIAEGIKVSGSVAVDAGYNLESYSAVLGNLIAKTRQSGSELGRSLRTMIVRTTNASKAAIVGGEVSTEEISDAEASLRRIGIEIRKNKESFKDFDTIISEIYKKLDNLSDVQLSDIAYNIASTRQTSQFKMLVKYYGDYLSLAEQANNAAGTTLINQDKYAESLQGHLGELKSTTESIWNNLLNSDVLKSGVDIFEELLSIIDKITSLTGGGGLLGLTGLGAGITAFAKNLD